MRQQGEGVGRPRRIGTDRLHRVQAEVAGEDSEPGQQLTRLRIQKPDTPLDRGRDRALPVGQVARRGDQHGKALIEPLEEHVRREHADAGGGQFEGERNTLQGRADAHHRVDVLFGDLEQRRGRPRPVAEQQHGGGLQRDLDAESRRGIGKRERLHLEDPLAAKSEQCPARHEERRLAQLREQLRERARRPGFAPSCRAPPASADLRRAREICDRVSGSRVPHPEGVRDRRGDSRGIVTCSSSTNDTSRSPRSATRWATSMARRLLPIPLGPVSVTRRTSSRSSSASTPSTSACRPIVSVYGAGTR